MNQLDSFAGSEKTRSRIGTSGRRAFLQGVLATPLLATPALTLQPTDKVVAAHYPPLMIEGGARLGLSVEILQHAAKRLGRSLDITFLPFPRALKVLQRRPDHFMPALFRNPVREPLYSWITRSHVEHLVFNTLGPKIDTLEDARHLARIGVETDAAMDVLLTRFGFDNLVRTSSPIITAKQLQSGHVDAWALTRSLATWVWRETGNAEPLVQGKTIGLSDVYLVGSRVLSPDLAAAYAGVLDDLHHDGTTPEILYRYGV